MTRTSRATGAIASFAALASLASPMIGSAAGQALPLLPQSVHQAIPRLTQPVQQAVQQLLMPPSVTDPIVALLNQAALTPGVPSRGADALRQLAAALTSGNPPTAEQIAADLRSIALTLGLPSQVSSQLNTLADAFGAGTTGSSGGSGSSGSGSNGGSGSSGANGAGSIAGFAGANPFGPSFNPNSVTASGRTDSRIVRGSGVVIKSVRYNAKRRMAHVAVACRAKTTSCNTAVAVYKGRNQATTPVAGTIASHHRWTFTVRVSKRAARTLAKRGGVLRAVAVSNTPYGQAHSAKSIHVKRGRH